MNLDLLTGDTVTDVQGDTIIFDSGRKITMDIPAYFHPMELFEDDD